MHLINCGGHRGVVASVKRQGDGYVGDGSGRARSWESKSRQQSQTAPTQAGDDALAVSAAAYSVLRERSWYPKSPSGVSNHFLIVLIEGFGHATRVSAIVEAVLELNASIEITIVSTAPSYVFNCLSKGAEYRHAEVDPVIVQPVAYAVDRRESLAVLRDFLNHREQKLQEEVEWLVKNGIDCVLSDAVFLAW